jgi:hypothetical protein
MKKYRAFDIIWDTDKEVVDLPNEAVIQMDDDSNMSLEGADKLSDEFGWCVHGFNYETLPTE